MEAADPKNPPPTSDVTMAAMPVLNTVPAEPEGDPNTAVVFTVGIVGAILVLATLIFGVVLFQNAQAIQTDDKAFAGKPPELAEQQTLQLATINQYRYVSEPDGIVAIPIDQAIDLFVARVRADPRQASPPMSSATQPTSAASATQPESAP